MAVTAQQIDILAGGLRTIGGEPLVGGKVYAYYASTSEPATLWQDGEKSSPHLSPAVLDGSGRLLAFGDGRLKIVVHGSDDKPYKVFNNVLCINPTNVKFADLNEVVGDASHRKMIGVGLRITGAVGGNNYNIKTSTYLAPPINSKVIPVQYLDISTPILQDSNPFFEAHSTSINIKQSIVGIHGDNDVIFAQSCFIAIGLVNFTTTPAVSSRLLVLEGRLSIVLLDINGDDIALDGVPTGEECDIFVNYYI